jgi:hypothetical protein
MKIIYKYLIKRILSPDTFKVKLSRKKQKQTIERKALYLFLITAPIIIILIMFTMLITKSERKP